MRFGGGRSRSPRISRTACTSRSLASPRAGTRRWCSRVSIAALIVLAIRRPRFPAGDALLTGIAVSLLVNDSPGAVASAGALSYAVLFAYEQVRRTGA